MKKLQSLHCIYALIKKNPVLVVSIYKDFLTKLEVIIFLLRIYFFSVELLELFEIKNFIEIICFCWYFGIIVGDFVVLVVVIETHYYKIKI